MTDNHAYMDTHGDLNRSNGHLNHSVAYCSIHCTKSTANEGL